MPKLTDLQKVFRKETISLQDLQKGKEIYNEIAKEGHNTKKWTDTNFAQDIMFSNFIKYLEENKEETQNFMRTLFSNENSYSATLAQKTEDDNLKTVISIKVKNINKAKRLIEDYDFYLRD